MVVVALELAIFIFSFGSLITSVEPIYRSSNLTYIIFHCPIKWGEASDLLIKETIHIQTTPMGRLINRDKGAEIPTARLLPSMLMHRNTFEQLNFDSLALGLKL